MLSYIRICLTLKPKKMESKKMNLTSLRLKSFTTQLDQGKSVTIQGKGTGWDLGCLSTDPLCGFPTSDQVIA